MKSVILCLIAALTVTYGNAQVTNKSDLLDMKVKGNVKSIKETTYKAIIKSGEVRKGKRKTENKDENDSYTVFNDKGKMIEKDNYRSDGTLHSKITYLYDKQGYIAEATVDEPKGHRNAKHTYINKYDGNGNVYEIKHYAPDSSVDNTYTYQYDPNGNIIECDWTTKGGKSGSKDLYKYDSKGNVTEDDMLNSDGSIQWKITYTYDDKGNCIEENTYKGAKFIIKYLRKFDDKGNQIEIDWCKEDGKPYMKYYEKYEYDKNGNWVTQTEFKKDKPTYIYSRELAYF